ncbi:Uu.00g063240.m01.CDS01 [Anthostomella pinea]|uniref:Uu.00g063240.m01.CDS01 n=1 Tax=Anthostomella pinea TaxID=933095 RepID=A0AAI8YMV5_9PEZI|nr:Uu.00g063240.m01.CDS01 [Anthostomella pinea]
MPYADNLYSMSDDSEGDDFADQLSPSDGYFASSSSNAIPSIPNVMVPDPTLAQHSETSAESKAREANEEGLLNTQRHQDRRPAEPVSSRESGRSEQATVVSSFVSPLRYHPPITYPQTSAPPTPLRTLPTRGRTPSVYSDAPPAYTPSPTSALSPATATQQTQPRNYSTFTSTMGVSEVENERLLGLNAESMSHPGDEEAGTPAWSRRVRRRLPAWFNWRLGLLALIILAVSVGFLVSSVRPVKDDNKTTIRPAEPVEQQPVEKEPQDPEEPNAPDTSAPATSFVPTYCEGAQHRFNDQILALNFDKSQNVTFLQDHHHRRHAGKFQVLVGGQVDVRRLDGGGDPRVVLEIATNDPELLLDVVADGELQVMKVSVPRKYDSTVEGQMPCVEMKATIWVPESADVGVLTIGVIHLDIMLLDDLSLRVADYTRVSSVTGDITSGASQPASYEKPGIVSNTAPDYTFVPAKESYSLDSRVIEVTTTSGNIGGNWPLNDMLGLHSTSGDIKVSITPKEELKSDPKSAVLSLSSISGAVHATEPVHDIEQIPLRDYLVDINDIALDLLPVINQAKISPKVPAQLETATTSGTTAVRVLEPIWFGSTGDDQAATVSEGLGDGELLAESISRSFNCLQALHKSTSGDIGLRYPQAWEGGLSAATTSGELKVRGKDVKIVKSKGGWAGHKMEARKGPAGVGSTIQVHALMGTLDAIIGDER